MTDTLTKPEFLPFTSFPIPEEQITEAAAYILQLDLEGQVKSGEVIKILTDEPFLANASSRTHFQTILLRKISRVINYDLLDYKYPSNLL
jgi:hypothetical protein